MTAKRTLTGRISISDLHLIFIHFYTGKLNTLILSWNQKKRIKAIHTYPENLFNNIFHDFQSVKASHIHWELTKSAELIMKDYDMKYMTKDIKNTLVTL